MTRRAPDSYYRRAKRDGYAARSVYKLQEMDRRYRLLRKGARVLDLGCHPGSWLQYASGRVGPGGLVVGVDLQPLAVGLPPNARFVQGDLLELDPAVLRQMTPAFDLVLSDAAPRTTGVAHADAARSLELVERALELACGLLKPGGAFLAKAYFGAGVDELIHRLKGAFRLGKAHKPPASRAQSKEIYLLGQGLKKPARL